MRRREGGGGGGTNSNDCSVGDRPWDMQSHADVCASASHVVRGSCESGGARGCSNSVTVAEGGGGGSRRGRVSRYDSSGVSSSPLAPRRSHHTLRFNSSDEQAQAHTLSVEAFVLR